jgi:hypothetical protein
MTDDSAITPDLQVALSEPDTPPDLGALIRGVLLRKSLADATQRAALGRRLGSRTPRCSPSSTSPSPAS